METGGGSSESPVEPKKGKSKIPRKAKESLLKQSYSLSLSFSLHICNIRVCVSLMGMIYLGFVWSEQNLQPSSSPRTRILRDLTT